MALWEDRSAPHSTAPPSEPRNHAESVKRIRGADPNDPPGAPELGSGGDAASPGRGPAAVAVRLSLRPRPPGADRAWIRVSRSCGEDWDCAPCFDNVPAFKGEFIESARVERPGRAVGANHIITYPTRTG